MDNLNIQYPCIAAVALHFDHSNWHITTCGEEKNLAETQQQIFFF